MHFPPLWLHPSPPSSVIVNEVDGSITVTGGKWTTYRKMAEETVDAAVATGRLPLNTKACMTGRLKLMGALDYKPTMFAEVGRGGREGATRRGGHPAD